MTILQRLALSMIIYIRNYVKILPEVRLLFLQGGKKKVKLGLEAGNCVKEFLGMIAIVVIFGLWGYLNAHDLIAFVKNLKISKNIRKISKKKIF